MVLAFRGKSAAPMRSFLTIACFGLKASHWQQDAPSRCVLHTTATCLSLFQLIGTAHLTVAGEQHAACTPSLQPPGMPAECGAGMSLS